MIIKNPLIIKKAKLQAKIATPTTSSQTIVADSGYDGLSEVQIEAVTSSIDSNITAENIKKDVTILGVTGTLESGGGGTPEPTPTSSAFFTFDGVNITGYAGTEENIILPKTYSTTTKPSEGLWCPSVDYINWFEYVRDMQEMEFFYNGERFFVYDSYVFDNLYSELEMRFPQGCYLTTAMANDAFAFNFLRYVNSSVNINGQSFVDGNSAFDYIRQNSILDVNFAGEVIQYIDGTDYEVTGIVERAFQNSMVLKTVDILSNITSIGNYAFSDCRGLTSITISNSVTSIGNGAFSNCSSLTSITIPDSVTSIGDGAFRACSGLTSITIPNKVTSFGLDVFSGCDSLTPSATDEVNKIAYLGNDSNPYVLAWEVTDKNQTSYVIKSRCKIIYDRCFKNCSQITQITIPSNVTSIGHYAFQYCSSLTSVTIPNSVTEINFLAFDGCSSLTSITIPSSVTSIGWAVFRECSSLTEITVDGRNKKYSSVDSQGNQVNCLIYEDTNTLIAGCKNSTIPGSVNFIGRDAFSRCSGLTSITIPNSVIKIEYEAFYYCRGLTSVRIGSGVQIIGYESFRGCSSLTSITIPSSVTSIETWAFANCSGLTSITIGNSVTSIGNGAFYGCGSLTSITIPDSVTSININAFLNCSSLTEMTILATTPPTLSSTNAISTATTKIYIPKGTLSAYQTATNWSNFADKFVELS